jgi:hypothetical protein
MLHLLKSTLTIAVVFLLQNVIAQDNVTAQDNKIAKDSLRIKYFLSATGLAQTGNVERILLPTQSSIAFSKNKIELKQTQNYSYGTIGTPAGKTKVEDELLVRTEFAVFQKKRLYPYTWGLYEKSNIRNITQRWLGGVGIGLNIINTKQHTLSFRNGIASEQTLFKVKEDNNVIRYSARIAGTHWLFNRKISIIHETFIQPAINKSEDLRFRTLWRINVPIWKHIALTTLIDNGYESVVDFGKKKNNFFISYGLNIAN